MVEAGIVTKDDQVELLEGWLVAKMTKNPPHEIAKGLAQDDLTRLAPEGWFIVVEGPTTTADSVPEPDLMVVRGSRRDYRTGAPQARDVALVVEVSSATLGIDRTLKRRIYARAGFPIYWIINVSSAQVEVHSEPTGPTDSPDYRKLEIFQASDPIPFLLNGTVVGKIVASELLP